MRAWFCGLTFPYLSSCYVLASQSWVTGWTTFLMFLTLISQTYKSFGAHFILKCIIYCFVLALVLLHLFRSFGLQPSTVIIFNTWENFRSKTCAKNLNTARRFREQVRLSSYPVFLPAISLWWLSNRSAEDFHFLPHEPYTRPLFLGFFRNDEIPLVMLSSWVIPLPEQYCFPKSVLSS